MHRQTRLATPDRAMHRASKRTAQTNTSLSNIKWYPPRKQNKAIWKASRTTAWWPHAPANRANYPGLDMHGAGKPPSQMYPTPATFLEKTKQVGRASRMTVWPLHAPANRANYPGLDMHGAGKPPTQIDPPKAALTYIYIVHIKVCLKKTISVFRYVTKNYGNL